VYTDVHIFHSICIIIYGKHDNLDISKTNRLKQNRSSPPLRYGNIYFFHRIIVGTYSANTTDFLIEFYDCTSTSQTKYTSPQRNSRTEAIGTYTCQGLWRGKAVMCIVLNNVFVSVSYS